MNDTPVQSQMPTKEEQEFAEKMAAANQPAVLVNRYWLGLGKNHIRFAFMETSPPFGNVRCAIAMDKSDAKALADSINLLLAEGIKQ